MFFYKGLFSGFDVRIDVRMLEMKLVLDMVLCIVCDDWERG